MNTVANPAAPRLFLHADARLFPFQIKGVIYMEGKELYQYKHENLMKAMDRASVRAHNSRMPAI